MKSFFKKIIVWTLELEARLILKKYSPTIIAVTGSVGKTSTKDAIYAILEGQVFVRKSEKSFNSEIGVPLTIIGCQNGWNNPLLWIRNIFDGLELIFLRADYPKCLVLEVGADHPGDIKHLTTWLHPDIALITTVSKVPVQVEYFSSPAAVLEEKLALVRAVKPTGKIVLPAHDPDILAVRTDVTVPCLTFALDNTADVTATHIAISYNNTDEKPVGMKYDLSFMGASIPVSISGVIGMQPVFAAVAASAAALAYGISFEHVAAAVSNFHAPRGRMNMLAGIGGSILIDDTYNSSPDATAAALSVLKEIKKAGGTPASSGVSRKIAILGDMMELGKFSSEQHKKVGELVAQASIDMLVVVGIRARDIALGAIAGGFPEGAIMRFDTSTEAADALKNIVGAGDVVLIKGSQSPRLERVTKALLADPSQADTLLVRQEPEWQKRL